MRTVDFSITVPREDAGQLQQLARDLNSSQKLQESRSLDGDTVVAAIVTLSGGGLAVLRTWIKAQVERQKAMTFHFNGRTFSGYSASDVEVLLTALAEATKPTDPPDKNPE